MFYKLKLKYFQRLKTQDLCDLIESDSFKLSIMISQKSDETGDGVKIKLNDLPFMFVVLMMPYLYRNNCDLFIKCKYTDETELD
jgi:hypothetical protein